MIDYDVEIQFGDATPDYLVDMLVAGLSDLLSYERGFSVSPDRPWIHSRVPNLRPPMLQCWSRTVWDQFSLTADPRVLIVTHAHDPAWIPRLHRHVTYAAKLAIDAYDEPCRAWRERMKKLGFEVFAREKPAPDEFGIDYAYNPLWVPTDSGPRGRFVPFVMAGDFTVGRRKEYANALTAYVLRFRPVLDQAIIAENLYFPDWQDALARSKVAIIPHGAGEKTYRLWESAAAGCALLVERFSPGNAPSGLIEGENCEYFDDAEDLVRKLGWLLSDETRLASRAFAARETAETQKTPQALAEYVLRTAGLISGEK